MVKKNDPDQRDHKAKRVVSSKPIPVHVTETLFDAPSQEEQLEKKRWYIRIVRRVIISLTSLWMKIASRVARARHWYPSVEPYIGYGTDRYVRLICRTVYAPALGHHRALQRGIYTMFVIPAVRVRVSLAIDDIPVETVQVGDLENYDKVAEQSDQSAQYCISDRAGYLDLITERALSVGKHVVSYSLANREPVTSTLFTVDASAPLGIISDVDDTIMVTLAPSPLRAAYNMLIMNPLHRNAVPHMASLFTQIAQLCPATPFFYLSTSPWNVEASIRHFIVREGYPEGPLLLRDLDPRPKTFVPSGPQHKLEFAQQLLDDFPNMRFVLIGDDGQKDPSTYARIIHDHPGRIAAVGIRQLQSHAMVEDFCKACARDFHISLSSRRFAYEQLGLQDESCVDQRRYLAGLLDDVPWFVSPDGAGLSASMIPFIQRMISANEECAQ